MKHQSKNDLIRAQQDRLLEDELTFVKAYAAIQLYQKRNSPKWLATAKLHLKNSSKYVREVIGLNGEIPAEHSSPIGQPGQIGALSTPELLRVRDAVWTLSGFGMADKDLESAVLNEIDSRVDRGPVRKTRGVEHALN